MSTLPLIKRYRASPLPIELFRNDRYSFLLDSGINVFRMGRFSFLGSDPFLVLKSEDAEDPFNSLREILTKYRLTSVAGEIPFTGGGVGFLGYDLNRFMEKVPRKARNDLGIPDLLFGFYDVIIAYDHSKKDLYIISTGLPEKRGNLRRLRAEERLKEISKRLNNFKAKEEPLLRQRDRETTISSNFTRGDYLQAVSRAKRYIAAGDIYQVNLSQRLCVDLNTDPFILYKRLRQINPTSFSSFLNMDGLTIASASPERFLKVDGRCVETRPMKGTRPRGKTPKEDEELRQELLNSKKDAAELVMIVDLERNDLGRVCEYGSVRVREIKILEEYATVFQTTSLIEGRLREDKDIVDLLRASFPGGSITGAPKIRAMEIIDELEPTERAVYTGSIGYIGFDGRMDLNIVIRTFLIKKKKAYFQVGGGIVADSLAEAEYEETLVKAKALMEAVNSI